MMRRGGAGWLVEVPATERADQGGEGPGRSPAADLAGRLTSPTDGTSADAHMTEPPSTIASCPGGPELSTSQTGTVTAGHRPATAHESAVLATIGAAYALAAKSGSISIRSHDLLSQLHRSASVLREATARVAEEARTCPDAAVARDALELLDEVGHIGLFYEGSVQ
jgi:hypothetical protein